jgi:hypothetical protein
VPIHAAPEPPEAIRRRRSAAFVDRVANSEAAAELGGHDAILDLQRTAGNRAVVAALALASAGPARGVLQRISFDDVIGAAEWLNPITFSEKALRTITGVETNPFILAEQAVRASASRITIPATYFATANRFIAARPDDGAVIRTALNQEPKHYQGGWLLDAQGGAGAITFGNSVFYKDSPPSEATFIHELVHISQYYKLGRSAFLVSYFGLSLATIIKRAIAGQPIEAMKSSPHERDAYALELRFKDWQKNP